MHSNSLYYYAAKAVKENPEVIEALMEFERTKRVPKISRKRRIDITVDDTVTRKFKAWCEKKGIPVSRAIERMMIERISAGDN